MRVHFVGNGQMARLQTMFQRSVESSRTVLTQIASDRNLIDQAMLERVLGPADIVVLQLGAGPNAGPPLEAVRAATQGEVVVVPDIYVDGIASLEREGQGEAATILGRAELLRAARECDRESLLRRFIAGEIDMRQQARFSASIARMRRIEQAGCDIRITDAIEDMVRQRPVVFCAASPTQDTIFRLFERLCHYLGVEPDAKMAWDPVFHASLAMPRGFRAFTPWDVRALGLGYEPDPHWYSQSVALVHAVMRLAATQEPGRPPAAIRA